jgi:hypothetical protein
MRTRGAREEELRLLGFHCSLVVMNDIPWLMLVPNPKADEDLCKKAIVSWFSENNCEIDGSLPFCDGPYHEFGDSDWTPFERFYFDPETAQIAVRMRKYPNHDRRRVHDPSGLLPNEHFYDPELVAVYELPSSLPEFFGKWHAPVALDFVKESDYLLEHAQARTWIKLD